MRCGDAASFILSIGPGRCPFCGMGAASDAQNHMVVDHIKSLPEKILFLYAPLSR
jgi:hypothetical protein